MSTDPLGATRPLEFVCVDTRGIVTRSERGQVFLAVDAFSKKVLAFDARPNNAVPDYIAFIQALDAKHDLRRGTSLVCDLPLLHRAEIMRNFPFKNVICDKRKAAQVTRDFQGYLNEQFGN